MFRNFSEAGKTLGQKQKKQEKTAAGATGLGKIATEQTESGIK